MIREHRLLIVFKLATWVIMVEKTLTIYMAIYTNTLIAKTGVNVFISSSLTDIVGIVPFRNKAAVSLELHSNTIPLTLFIRIHRAFRSIVVELNTLALSMIISVDIPPLNIPFRLQFKHTFLLSIAKHTFVITLIFGVEFPFAVELGVLVTAAVQQTSVAVVFIADHTDHFRVIIKQLHDSFIVIMLVSNPLVVIVVSEEIADETLVLVLVVFQ